jgi:hypothetical protein
MLKIDRGVQAILDRLARVDLRRPEPDRVAIEQAMRRYLRMIGHPGVRHPMV